MFDSIGLAIIMKVALYVNAALAILIASDTFELLSMPFASQVAISVTAVSGLIFLLGQTAIFSWLCRLPGVWRLFPNISAEYEVEVSSNWSIIEARNAGLRPELSDGDDPVLFRRVGKATIFIRLCQIDMKLNMDDEYLTSETLTFFVQRHRGERNPVLYYVYESHVSKPKSTDSQRHLGAARISVPSERFPKVLTGNYWTDRDWHRGLNTAGQIRLIRI